MSAADKSETQYDPEQARDRKVYRYLLTLTELGLSKRSGTPNETSIAKQWGVKDNRIFIRRMLRSVLREEYYQNKPKEKQKPPPPVPGLTLFKLVNILSSLRDYQKRQQRSPREDEHPPTKITHSAILKALQLFSQLTAAERSQLAITVPPGEVIIQQILAKATNPTFNYEHPQALQLYNFFLKQLGGNASDSFGAKLESLDMETDRTYIYNLVEKHTEQYFPGLEPEDKHQVDHEFTEKVEREINRINLQSGIEQADRALPSHNNSRNQRLHRYLTADFIRRLVHSVIDNELITDEFPVHLKFIEIKRVRPLPLYIRQEDEKIFALNPALLQNSDNQEAESVEGLERQVAYRIRLHFYIKLPEDYDIAFDRITSVNTVSGQRRLEFSEEVVGIGCPTSHIATVINRVLLWDIQALEDFLPVVNGLHCKDEIMGETPNSPVWSHCVARIYRREDISRAIASEKHRDDVATAAETASADFCGFDLIETSAKAALLVRLKLIKQILSSRPNISATDYIKQLCHRVEELTALKRSLQCLTYYPFSLRAMEGQMDATIFKNRYRQKKPGFVFETTDPQDNKEWSTVALEAQIAIAEANLKEGLSHIAKRYLELIQPYFEGGDTYQVSNSLRARYCLCWFRYYYLGDLEHQKSEFPDRYFAVRQAEEELEKAEKHLTERLRRYDELNELVQINLHPHFYLLSRIRAHRAKLHIFFPRYMQKLSPIESLIEPVKLLEKARIYAARDGDSALYAQWSAYQSWCYIMLAYLTKAYPSKQITAFSKDFSEQNCFVWAQQLIEHASICFSPTGRICYREIKDNGGKTTQYAYREESSARQVATHAAELAGQSKVLKYYELYGKTMIEVVPLIKELYYETDSKEEYNPANNMVALDLSLLKDRKTDEESSIYLFGMQSSILLFAQGMLALCQPYGSEEDLVRAVKNRALKLFNYCCAIASDGTQRNPTISQLANEDEPGAIVLDRFFSSHKTTQQTKDTVSVDESYSKARLLRCLYPHRLTQFADLANIFIIACELVLLVSSGSFKRFYGSYEAWVDIPVKLQVRVDRIRSILTTLRTNNHFPFPLSNTCGQKRYNGHLAEHYIQLEKSVEGFIEALQAKELSDTSSTAVRNLIVTEFFRIIRGETSSLSSD